ncbi:hypothetical protein JTB14_012691 [Gonioctena quinquepunctata]|nr:hypothetical protein JTB14_012691 [Gonioctena quinquepunctata]
MVEQASQQRVGAFTEKEKVTINFEEMYKNSKTKCRKVLRNTSNIFKKKNHDNSDETGSEIVRKNQLSASDIEYKLNYSDSNSELNDSKVPSADCVNDSRISTDSKVSSENCANESSFSNGSKLSNEDSKKEDFDFGAIKCAFKRKLFSNEVSIIIFNDLLIHSNTR